MVLELEIDVEDSDTKAVDVLAAACSLSRGRIKDAMNKGAVWLQRGSGVNRIRRASRNLRAGDRLRLYYNPEILAQVPPPPLLVADLVSYSVWFKPAGLLSSGSRFGDHTALPRWVEMHDRESRQVFVVHRLDRAASGVMLLAHNRGTAAGLSELFRLRKVDKRYKVKVKGMPAAEGRIDTPLDGKVAITHYSLSGSNAEEGNADLDVRIETGRKHQIRRHLASLGHPIVGDRLYGPSQDTSGSLALVARSIGFNCPVTGRYVSYEAPGA